MIRFKPLCATLAVVIMLVASREPGWLGCLDRLIQAVVAYGLFWFAFKEKLDG